MPGQPTAISLPAGAATPELRRLASTWAEANAGITSLAFGDFITSLIHDRSAASKTMGGILLGYMPNQRGSLHPELYDDWLEHTEGWAAVDAICYNNFTAAEMLGRFESWKVLIMRLAKSSNPNKRRAAIVLLTKPVKQSADTRLSDLSFRVIDILSRDTTILITKAVSWLLRHLTRHHAQAVRKYLVANRDKLPAVAIRETTHKLKHGTKSSKKHTS